MAERIDLTKQHACLTTFEGLIELRNHQADIAGKIGNEGEFDTIYHDYTLLDELVERLSATDNAIVRKGGIIACD